MARLLHIYADDNLGYSWKKASLIVATMQDCGPNPVQCICKWVMGFLKWRDLLLHKLDWKQGTVIDEKDIAKAIKEKMKERMRKGFLKAQNLVEIVTSPDMKAIFTQKGISKPTISLKTVLHWLVNLRWSYGKLKNEMYLNGHERPDVMEYRQAFVEHFMSHER